jgi:hypothetical protein
MAQQFLGSTKTLGHHGGSDDSESGIGMGAMSGVHKSNYFDDKQRGSEQQYTSSKRQSNSATPLLDGCI